MFAIFVLELHASGVKLGDVTNWARALLLFVSEKEKEPHGHFHKKSLQSHPETNASPRTQPKLANVWAACMNKQR